MIWLHSFIDEAPVTHKSVSLNSRGQALNIIQSDHMMGIVCADNRYLYQNAVQMSWSKRTGERGLLASLSLKTTEGEVLNLKSKEYVNPFILFTNFSTRVHFSAAGLSKLPTGTQQPHSPLFIT